jgi:hypothetical protein
MAKQLLATLWTPDIWIPGIAEKQATFPHLFNSGAVRRTDLLTELASGPGTYANVPFLKDITDQTNEVQVEGTAPTTINGNAGDVCKFPILNRVTKSAWTAMSKNVSGADIMSHVWGTMGERRLKQYQTTLIAQLRGLLGTGTDAAGNAAALKDVRYGGSNEPFSENGAAPTSDKLMSPDIFIRAKALMGELADTLKNGCLFVHPDVLAQLEILDVYGFRTLQKPSDLPFTVTTYREVPIFTSSALRRAGSNSGYVYDTYLIANGTIGFGEKPQVADQADLSSLAYFYDRDLNDDIIWDRVRVAFGLDGTAAVPANYAASSATDAELQAIANWSLKYQSANRVGVVGVRTNG